MRGRLGALAESSARHRKRRAPSSVVARHRQYNLDRSCAQQSGGPVSTITWPGAAAAGGPHALRELGWEPRRGPARSVAAYATWLEGMEAPDGVLADADARMRALGVVRKVET